MISVSRTFFASMAIAAFVTLAACTNEQPSPSPVKPVTISVVDPTSWALVDELGRTDDPNDLRETRADKYVALFYWSWHQDGEGGSQCWGKMNVNVSDIEKEHPEALTQAEFYDDDPIWGYRGQAIFWGKPLYGYYRTTDEWVLRKHAELLAAAGVDVIFFDCTNGTFTWDDSANAIMKAWSEARADGVKTPSIAFMLPFVPNDDSLVSLRHIYGWIYSQKLYSDLWFCLDGKPVVMAYPDNLTSSYVDQQIKNTFTFHPGQPDYVNGPIRNDQWGWLEVYPQHVFGTGTNTEVTVGVAQNAAKSSGGHCSAFNDPLSFGRSYTDKNGHNNEPQAYLQGLNFQEQWDRAHSLDPRVIFVSGWNEWVAGRQDAWPQDNPYKPFSFPDEYNSEKSRDIEPNAEWGDYGDNYYCQLVRNVRKFKGVSSAPKVTDPVTVSIGKLEGWDYVGPDYKTDPNNVFDRNHPDHTRSGAVITNTSGRNDLVRAKVARDDDNIYFYVETKGRITDVLSSHAGQPDNWMRLFINLDRNYATGWKGYDFCLNYLAPDSKTSATLSRHSGSTSNDWAWKDAGKVTYYVKNNKLEVCIPRTMLGLTKSKALDFEFKWSDNMQKEGDIMDFYQNGDCAPIGRFNFVYTTSK